MKNGVVDAVAIVHETKVVVRIPIMMVPLAQARMVVEGILTNNQNLVVGSVTYNLVI